MARINRAARPTPITAADIARSRRYIELERQRQRAEDRAFIIGLCLRIGGVALMLVTAYALLFGFLYAGTT